MAKLKIPADCNFKTDRAMELANLIQRAYEQYNNYENSPKSYWKSVVPNDKLIGSMNCDINLDDPNNKGRIEYKILALLKFTEYKSIIFPELLPFLSETVPFGFIAERQLENGVPGIFIVFRGTLTKAEWYFNSQFKQTYFMGDRALGLVSSGFNKIYIRPGHLSDVRSLEKTVIDTLKTCSPNSQIFVTGHSLGGALATMATLHIAKSLDHPVINKPILYTYASPRVGDKQFAQHFYSLECYRIANSEDMVVRVPPSTGKFIGPEMSGKSGNNKNTTKATPSQNVNARNMQNMAGGDIRRNSSNQVYEHVGEPLYFTEQKEFVSTNHNMVDTYRRALPNS
jgi:triacylglycerol lipase